MMHRFILISLFAFPWAATSQNLFEALEGAGASNFARIIQSDDSLLATYTSGLVRTVFAPLDSTAPRKRQEPNPADQQRALLQASDQEGDIASYRRLPGRTVPTFDDSARLGGRRQSVVTDARNSTANTTRRWDLTPRQAEEPLRVTSGLGNRVDVISGDIPFNGGFIHIVNDYFTIPELLSTTAQATGQTTFADLLSSANMTQSLDNAPLTTFFVPSNAALDAAGLSTPGPETAAMLAEHVVPNFAGYLPELQDGLVLPNQNGNALTISVRAGEYFVGDARIVQANQILMNGVAHVIDKASFFKPNWYKQRSNRNPEHSHG
ncbi:hypothetical protein DL770_011778 [Monosporascus sp. CRB-9-2]|nr:hypothetical protein DL770_011778 [Monosporascus sp. CRB-9-2]